MVGSAFILYYQPFPVTRSYPSTAVAVPTFGEPTASAVVTWLNRGSMGNFKVFLLALKHLSRLCTNTPWRRGGAIHGAINNLTYNQDRSSYVDKTEIV